MINRFGFLRGIFPSVFFIVLYFMTGALCSVIGFSDPAVMTSACNLLFTVPCGMYYLTVVRPRGSSVRQYDDKMVGFFILMFLIVFITCHLFNDVLYRFGVTGGDLSGVSITMYLMLSFIIAPITEEVFMRGVVFRTLRSHFSFFGAAIVSSFVFAAFHGSVQQFLSGLIFGCYLAFLVEITGKLRYAAIVHAIYNIFSFFWALSVGLFVNVLPIWCVSILIFIFCFFGMFLIRLVYHVFFMGQFVNRRHNI